MKKTLKICASILGMFSILTLSSCNKDNGDSYSGDAFTSSSTYLICCADNGATPSGNSKYYSEIDKAISNNELLYTHHGSTRYYDKEYHATHSAFVSSDGCLTTMDKTLGRFQNTICWWMQGYQIDDSSTITWVDLLLCEDESFNLKGNYTKLKTVYEGKNLKTISWYITKTYYTYTEIQGKLYLSNGNILTRAKDGLIQDGNSFPYVKYDLNSLQ